MKVFERSFSVECQILKQIYFIDDIPKSVLYIGSIKEPGGMGETVDCLMLIWGFIEYTKIS